MPISGLNVAWWLQKVADGMELYHTRPALIPKDTKTLRDTVAAPFFFPSMHRAN